MDKQQGKNTEFTFQYYRANIKSNKPIGYINLNQFIKCHINPKDNIKEVFRKIVDAEQTGNRQLKAELKQNNLYYFTPCVQVYPYRRYSDIRYFTGLLVLDFDHINNAKEFKQFLFDNYKFIIAVWLSPSKYGVKCLVKIPVVNTVDEFKEYYYGIVTEMEIYNGFDGSGQNPVLPLFQSYDPELLFRDDFDIWEIKGIKVSDFTTAIELPPSDIDITDKDKQTVIKIINTGFNNINDYGHPPLRGLCIAVGGYVSAGYISEHDAIDLVKCRIENHPYLSKGVTGYKKTAEWSIMTGKKKPIYLSHGKS
jgi:VirE N-terminal domain